MIRKLQHARTPPQMKPYPEIEEPELRRLDP
jgi:hypothetical protein